MPSSRTLTGLQVAFIHRASCANPLFDFGDEPCVTQIFPLESYATVEDVLSEEWFLCTGIVKHTVSDKNTVWLYVISPDPASSTGYTHYYVDIQATPYGTYQPEDPE